MQKLIKVALDALRASETPNPTNELRYILGHVLDNQNYLDFETLTLTDLQKKEFQKIIRERNAGKPLAKIIGIKEFWSDKFFTNEHTLDPRPETEIIIEAVLELKSQQANLRILDLGTGTGCILLTLLKEFSNASGVGIDISAKALKVAEKNSRNLNLTDRVQIFQSNWFEKVTGKFDIITANPPYISTNCSELEENVKKFEPHAALLAGNDGCAAYREIFKHAKNFLTPNGWMFVEIGKGQEKIVTQDIAEFICRIGSF